MVTARNAAKSNMTTARIAEKILLAKKTGYMKLTKTEKNKLVQAFALSNKKPLYGNSFDLIRTKSKIDFGNRDDIIKNIDKIKLIEVKSSDKKDLHKKGPFSEYYFGLTDTELLMGQAHTKQYLFVFVDINTKKIFKCDLRGLFRKITNVHLVWHVHF